MSRGTPLRRPRPPMSTWWWVRKPSYFVFVLRELSSVFVAWFVVFWLLLVNAVRRGDAAYQDFLDWAASPWLVAVNVVALLFVTFHAVTWFNLTPQAMAPRVRGTRIPGWAILLSQYVGWAVVSAFVVWLLVGAG